MNQNKGHHLTPIGHYIKVIIALLFLTGVTVAAARINLGHWNTPIAMAIAVTKALLVMMIFMGLKYDTAENNVTIFCTLIFLGIFVFLTWSDLFYRIPETPIKPEVMAAAAPVDIDKLLKSNPELVKRGGELFKVNCVTCHGDKGEGNGVAASALNPKPRNFTNGEKFKQGDTVTKVARTITMGVKGSSMPAFPSFSVQDRFALAHFVRSLGSGHAEDTAADVEASGFKGGEKVTPKIPVEAAMDILVKEAGKRKD